ncbi:Transducin/WD40 repeat-like superfamily protein [Forsythia ovata]|uniref:Transducin/WD40 repeat-like superfamily protein n=1 Tax=Forsythia ovata TaxID=205694 RepID=A0ABD1T948_9LAMI
MEEAEGPVEIDMGTPLGELLKRKSKSKKQKTQARSSGVARNTEPAQFPGPTEPFNSCTTSPGIITSVFDYSVENHFKAVDTISKLCGEPEIVGSNQNDIQRFSNSIKFLSEWRHFSYVPRTVRFACRTESNRSKEKDVIGRITLPQFSAATVPKEAPNGGMVAGSESSKDFVMFVGGKVWALDWCPRVDRSSLNHIKSEFVAVAAHPPESSYHKIGVPLTGRGIIQIWCLLNVCSEEDVPSQVNKKRKLITKKKEMVKASESTKPQRPRGRPRKKPTKPGEKIDSDSQYVQALAIEYPEDSSGLYSAERASANTSEQVVSEHSGTKHDDSESAGALMLAPQVNKEKETVEANKSTRPQRPRGRSRKKPINEPVEKIDSNSQYVQPLAVEYPEDSSRLHSAERASANTNEQVVIEDSRTKLDDSVNADAFLLASQLNKEKETAKANKSTKPQRPIGRPGKKPVERIDSDCQYVQPLAIEYSEDSSRLRSVERASANRNEQVVSEDSRTKPVDSVNADALLLASQVNKKRPKLSTKKKETVKAKESTKLQRPRGRPRKKPINEPVEKIDSNSQYVQPLAVEYPEDSSRLHSIERASANMNEQVVNEEKLDDSVNADALLLAASKGEDSERKRDQVHSNVLHFREQDEHVASSLSNVQGSASCSLDSMRPSKNITYINPCDSNTSNCCVPTDVALPRMMLCLAHNGKVAWDVKWRPFSARDTGSMHRMGYLAVLLGNGALEVWEVPFPRTIKLIYPACQKEGTDPRFIKLAPVFRCSMLKCGDRQSIPLTVEWSTSSLHDMILAGCHDGVVALWKFSTTGSSTDTRPLLCFSADTVPIRTLAWAPVQSDSEGTNVIVTAGHKGLKFWDIRDPYRPLWDLNPVQGVIYSLDWLPDPRCIIGSGDDGSIWVLSLVKAAYDIPVTGKPFSGTQRQGLHSYHCASFPIWSIQASRLTGMVAYCGEDGTAVRFQLTTRAVEKDPLRNRPLHFLSGSLMEEESTLTLVNPLTNTPIPKKKSLGVSAVDDSRIKSGSLAVINQEKRANEQTAICQASDEKPLAICFGNDLGTELESDSPCMVNKSKPAPKSKMSSKNKLKADQQAEICREDDIENLPGEGSEKGQVGQEIDVFPPKIVAMHKVRWNMNKGSEKWLCYGGAAGLVRCQEVDMST